jgi:hypothetical protein
MRDPSLVSPSTREEESSAIQELMSEIHQSEVERSRYLCTSPRPPHQATYFVIVKTFCSSLANMAETVI